MSDFVQMMKDWKRMCDAMEEDQKCRRDGCELYGNPACNTIFDTIKNDVSTYAEVERVVTKWAKEHPEPTYPTWAEWLTEQGVLASPIPIGTMSVIAYFGGIRSQEPIPEEMAKKLDIKPKAVK